MPFSRRIYRVYPSGEIDLQVLIGLVGNEPDDLRMMLNEFKTGVIAQHIQIREAMDRARCHGLGAACPFDQGRCPVCRRQKACRNFRQT